MTELESLQAENRRLKKMLETYEHHYNSLNLCPDHRDKLSGRCIVCDGERRGKLEERERLLSND